MINKQVILFLTSLLIQTYGFNYDINPVYNRIDYNKQSICIDPISQKGFNLQGGSNIRGYPDAPIQNGKSIWCPTITFPDPKLGKMISVNAKRIGLNKFKLINNEFNPYYYLIIATVNEKNSNHALYLIDYLNSKVVPIVEKNTDFCFPILNKNKCLYYEFADRNKKPHVYRLCAKSKKIQLFPIELSSIGGWMLTSGGERIRKPFFSTLTQQLLKPNF